MKNTHQIYMLTLHDQIASELFSSQANCNAHGILSQILLINILVI